MESYSGHPDSYWHAPHVYAGIDPNVYVDIDPNVNDHGGFGFPGDAEMARRRAIAAWNRAKQYWLARSQRSAQAGASLPIVTNTMERALGDPSVVARVYQWREAMKNAPNTQRPGWWMPWIFQRPHNPLINLIGQPDAQEVLANALPARPIQSGPSPASRLPFWWESPQAYNARQAQQLGYRFFSGS